MSLVTKLFVVAALLPLLTVDLVLEVEPETRITQRVLFVVDRSGSMHGDHFTRALAGMRSLVEFPTDDLEIGVIAFNDASLRWPGKPEAAGKDGPAVPPGWARLPSSTAVEEAQNWLIQLGAGGDTLLMPALHAALSEPRTKLSVIIVTDGLFGRERSPDIHELIAGLQHTRERRGLDHAVIAVYGLGVKQTVLVEIAQNGRGGYVREESPLPEEEFIPLPQLQPY